MTVSTEDFVGPADLLKTAGLDKPGQYLFFVKTVKPIEATQFFDAPWLNRKIDDKYPGIQVTFVLKEKAVYNEKGELTATEDLNGKQTRTETLDKEDESDRVRIRTLYKIITGQNPTGTLNPDTGRYDDVNYYDLMIETLGGEAWNSIYHTDPEKRDDKQIFANMGRKFDKRPWNRIKVSTSASPGE